jgi:hypothetical protein
LNKGSESEQTTRPVNLRDGGVDIDLPSRTEIEGALKFLKNNKAASADSIAAELLKNGGPNLVKALHEVILAWTSETLPRSWTEGVLCPVYKKGEKLKTIEGFASYTRHTKFSPKFYTTASYLTLTLPFNITRLGSNQINQQQTNSLHSAKFCNEFNITTHQLFIDFKAAYDTIIRNEVYVGMSELNFPTKLIRLIKTTLTTVTCCVKIQNDCSESFETRQGLRQGDVYYLRCLSLSCWKLSYDEQTYKQPAQSTTKKHNYSYIPMI